MNYRERVSCYLESIAPQGASNRQIAANLGIRWYASVSRATRQLMAAGRIHREMDGKRWVYSTARAGIAPTADASPAGPAAEATEAGTIVTAQAAGDDLRRRLLKPLLEEAEGRVWFLERLRCPCTADEARAAVVSFRRRPLRDVLERDRGLLGDSPEGQERLVSLYNAVFGLPDDCGIHKVWHDESTQQLRLPLPGRENAWTPKLLRKHIAHKRYLKRARRALRTVQTRVDAFILAGSQAVLVRCAEQNAITERQYARLKALGGALEQRLGKHYFIAGVVNGPEQLGVLDLAHVTWDEIRAWLANSSTGTAASELQQGN